VPVSIRHLRDARAPVTPTRLHDHRRLQRGPNEARQFARHSDRELYKALLAGQLDVFLRLARDLYEALQASGCTCVVADWRDGYNSLHDVCRFVTEAASLGQR